MFVSSLSFFLLPLLASCPHICIPLKPPLTSAPSALCPSTSLFSGDSPEQRSAATWQRASSVPSLSGDHQWDLHPCTCAKLAGGLPQSHTRHYGVCVASPIHLHLSWTSVTVFCLSLLCPSVLLLHPGCLDFLTYYMCSLSIPIAVVSRGCSLVSPSRNTDRPVSSILSKLLHTNNVN